MPPVRPAAKRAGLAVRRAAGQEIPLARRARPDRPARQPARVAQRRAPARPEVAGPRRATEARAGGEEAARVGAAMRAPGPLDGAGAEREGVAVEPDRLAEPPRARAAVPEQPGRGVRLAA